MQYSILTTIACYTSQSILVVLTGRLAYAKNMPIDVNESRQHITQFLSQHTVGVLATADATGKPHAATVYVAHDQQLNLYFITKRETQKSWDLTANPWGAIAIYDADTQTTVQARGAVSEVQDTTQTEWVFTEIWRIAQRTSSNIPPTVRMSAGGYVVYRLSAPTLRMATFNRPDPAQYETIFEVVQ